LPKMLLNPRKKNVLDFEYDDFEIQDYDPHPHIRGAISV